MNVIRRFRCVPLFVYLLVAAVVAPSAFGQQAASATLGGRVRDAAGSSVRGASVTVTRIATGAEREGETSDDGTFVVTNLPAGEYEVVVRAQSFAERRIAPVTLEVGKTATLDVDVASQGVSERVDVHESESPVDTATSVVDGVISSRQIENLPLNGRNFLELALLIPGNSPAPNFDPTKTNTVEISSAGQLGRGGNVTIDGADNNDEVVGGPLMNVSEDAVAEFQIATNRFSAEHGRSGSSVINVVTRSGGNDVHGTGSVFFRDRKIQALPATFDRAGATPPFDREQYSFGVGGPIVRNKAFWFGALEYRNQDGAVLVGSRDLASRSIVRGFADSPLNDLLATGRVDWDVTDDDQLTFRGSLERGDDTSASTLIRSIGSASQRQASENHYGSLLASWTRVISPTAVNSASFGATFFTNDTQPVLPGPQLTFPSIQDGASFRVPQQTRQKVFQFADTLSLVRGEHTLRMGGDVRRILGRFDLGVFREGRVELAEDFPDFDRNGDGAVDDDDLLIAVTLRSAVPDRDLSLPNCNNWYAAGFVQDDWRVSPRFTLNLGLRYEIDSDVKNLSGVGNINPIVAGFLAGERHRDKNNFGPRIGFNWDVRGDARTSIHGGYGIYYDRVTLEIVSLERGLDGRALPIDVRAGNVFFIDPSNGTFAPGAPTVSNPFTGFVFPGAGAGGINIIDNDLQNPMVQQMNVGVEQRIATNFVARADYLHNLGTHFIIGRTIGTVFNPVVGGPDVVKNLESSVNTKYDGLLLSLERRYADRYQMRLSYTLSKAFNYANDDQIPFQNGPIDSNNLQLEYGPTPNDQRHRFVASGTYDLPADFRLGVIWTVASGVPLDIVLPDGSSRIPSLQRNAGGRLFHTGAELNQFIAQVNAGGGVNGAPLPFVDDDARFNDSFNSTDVRLSRAFHLGERVSVEPIAEVFNVFNVTNVLGVSNVNYSGFSNVLVRDSNDPASPGFLHSSSFGSPVTTAGGVFGSGGPRALQLAVRVAF